jgi:hypothetical protein
VSKRDVLAMLVGIVLIPMTVLCVAWSVPHIEELREPSGRCVAVRDISVDPPVRHPCGWQRGQKYSIVYVSPDYEG